ncbi:Response regulator receiver modulated metal dependent phosphohydrolase [Candidatus Terasakiella magnetica]|uniref:Response regulator receiver modulated metal dependent phosphohydrolase n=1 Tax=Candidatus Terasakiella magnetica TaxID=1867952 RepID=A0A1C3RJQ9_9PROT|nr:HD domain-containing phosphohydrolase [Candidatus Terasakiella magnetica]SCA57467.1 Response regulator receiver modulated metal dependent phosphohydrolase [Candidatus Terasakiella magnetica]
MYVNLETSNILICDDSITNVAMLKGLLEASGFEDVTAISDSRKVMPLLQEKEYDLLLLDLEMPHFNGFDIIRMVRSQIDDPFFPILMLTGTQGVETRNKALKEGANDFVNKPFDQYEVLLRVKNLLQVRASFNMQKEMKEELERKVTLRTKNLEAAAQDLIDKLAMAGEYRDNQTGLHVKRVSKYARFVAEEYGLPDEVCDMIEKAAPMHDIGKIGISDDILLKPGLLDTDERAMMKKHVELGAILLENHSSLLVQMGRSVAVSHHEKWDGTGYPTGLKGEQIPIEGRIVGLVDVFDALTSKRPYKDAWAWAEAVNYIQENSGTEFDPKLVDIFLGNINKVEDIYNQYREEAQA